MHAAAEGRSTLGIPKSIGQDFAAADAARGPKKLPEKKSKKSPKKKLTKYLDGEE